MAVIPLCSKPGGSAAGGREECPPGSGTPGRLCRAVRLRPLSACAFHATLAAQRATLHLHLGVFF